MEQKIVISQIIKKLKTSSFFMDCELPMGYVAGFPVMQVRNKSLCLLIPYMKYQTTGEVDKTLVFPIRYTILLELPAGKVIGFENLEYSPAFQKVDFTAPAGYFRHEDIQCYNRRQYQELYDELMAQYDKAANALIYGTEYSAKDEKRMRELLQLLVEPSLRLMYQTLDADFYQKYLSPDIMEAAGKCAAALKAADMENLADEVEKVYKSALRDHFTIAVVGEFNRGKSTFLNRLLNREFLPVGDLPMTAVQTRIRYSSHEALAAFDEKNRKVFESSLSPEAWDELTAHHFEGEDFKGTAFVGIDDQWLKDSNIEFMDTPGAGDLSEVRARVIGDALLGCDGAIITISATAALSLSEKLFIEERLIARKMPFLILIVTKLDMVPLRERVDVLRYIENRLKNWNMDIPMYVPYQVELTTSDFEDRIGMDKVRAELESWVRHPERLGVAGQWVKEKTIGIMEFAISSLTEQKQLMDAANEKKREELIAVKKEQIQKASLIWSRLNLSMQEKCTQCYEFLLKKVDEYTENITERLQYEAGHAATPQKWWKEDYPYRLKIELTNMAAGVENVISRRISEDMQWYSMAIEKAFSTGVLYHKDAIAGKEMFGDFKAGRDLEFENLDKKRNVVRIGAVVLSVSGVALFSALGFLPIIATMGVGTTTNIISEKVFKQKVEEQRAAIKDEIAGSVPGFIQDCMAESEARLNAVYNDILKEADKSEQLWLEAQRAAVEAAVVPQDTKQYERLCGQIALLEREKDSIDNL